MRDNCYQRILLLLFNRLWGKNKMIYYFVTDNSSNLSNAEIFPLAFGKYQTCNWGPLLNIVESKLRVLSHCCDPTVILREMNLCKL